MSKNAPSYDPAAYEQEEMIEVGGLIGMIGRRRKAAILSLLNKAYARDDGWTLDVGCGYGEILASLPGERKIGIDINGLALAKAAHRNADATLIASGITTIPFTDKSFDIVVCSEVLEHFDDPRPLARELWRVMRPNGHLAVTVPNEWISTFGRFLLQRRPYKSLAHKRWFTPRGLAALFPEKRLFQRNIPFAWAPFAVSTNVAFIFRKPP